MKVPDSLPAERSCECIGIELGHMPRFRNRPDIDKLRDAVVLQQRDEFIDRMRRMPNRKNRENALPAISFKLFAR